MSATLLFVLVSWISIIPSSSRAQDWGRELYFPAYYFFAEKHFVNHLIKTMIVKDLDECEYRCYLDANCVSLNIKNKYPNGTHECELNNATHLDDEGDLKYNPLYYYRGTDPKCGKNRRECENNATCQSGFTPKGYRCLCTTGFEGEHCEKDIDECSQGKPCETVTNSECKNTDGSYNCQCKDGFVKEGDNCEVDVCRGYTNFTSADRKDTHSGVTNLCDSGLTSDWYRFEGQAGTRMPTYCVSENRCGTSSPGWLNGDHPTVADGEVTREVCFNKDSNCCDQRHNIQVKNCTFYYIYHLSNPSGCYLRYCGTD